MSLIDRKKKGGKQSTRELLGIEEVREGGILTAKSELAVCFSLAPDNLAVLSDVVISGRIEALLALLKSLPCLEICCLNSRESFSENKAYLKKRRDEETNPKIRQLLEQDLFALDQLQINTCPSRDFLLIVRYKENEQKALPAAINTIEKNLKEQGFTTKRMDKEALKSLLAVYIASDMVSEEHQNYDGERWVRLHDWS